MTIDMKIDWTFSHELSLAYCHPVVTGPTSHI